MLQCSRQSHYHYKYHTALLHNCRCYSVLVNLTITIIIIQLYYINADVTVFWSFCCELTLWQVCGRGSDNVSVISCSSGRCSAQRFVFASGKFLNVKLYCRVSYFDMYLKFVLHPQNLPLKFNDGHNDYQFILVFIGILSTIIMCISRDFVLYPEPVNITFFIL